MKYDIDDLIKAAFENEESQRDNCPSNILNQETISKMREINDMKNSKSNSKMRKIAKIVAAVACVCVIVSASTVAYSAIAQHFKYSIEMEDGVVVEFVSNTQYKDLPQDKLDGNADGNLIHMQWSELEEMLGFSLLGSGSVRDGMVNYGAYLNKDGSVGVVNLWIPEYKVYGEPLYAEDGYKYYGKIINLSIDVLDVNADQGYVDGLKEGNDAMGGKELVEKYHSKSLDTEVVIYNTNNSEDYVSAVFGYDGAYYSLQGDNVSVEEMKVAIEGMKK